MSNNEHTITPPPELVQQWRDEWVDQSDRSGLWVGEYIATQAARWAADRELDACCEWAAEQDRGFDDELRAARRPKPPSLKAQALDDLDTLVGRGRSSDTIRRALEQLDD
jgi:hypothetical protein